MYISGWPCYTTVSKFCFRCQALRLNILRDHPRLQPQLNTMSPWISLFNSHLTNRKRLAEKSQYQWVLQIVVIGTSLVFRGQQNCNSHHFIKKNTILLRWAIPPSILPWDNLSWLLSGRKYFHGHSSSHDKTGKIMWAVSLLTEHRWNAVRSNPKSKTQHRATVKWL